MRYFLLAGEASGDNLGALLIAEIQILDAGAVFGYWGGPNMQAATGLSPKRSLEDLAFMGFVEVVMNLRTIRRLEREIRVEVEAFAPDVLILIDYPGFNLRLGRWAKQQGIRVEFYVSPQIWAWRQGRVHKVVKSVDRMLCVLPFEQAFYAKFGYDAEHGYNIAYTGHPLPMRIDAFERSARLTVEYATGPKTLDSASTIVALMPGSRVQEVEQMLEIMLQGVRRLDMAVVPVIAAAPVLAEAELRRLSIEYNVGWVRSSYELLSYSSAACVASGTATLETALFGVPQVVCYKGSSLSVALARRLVKVDHIALVNIILAETLVPELIQAELNPASLSITLRGLFTTSSRAQQLAGYAKLRGLLRPYDATQRAATLIVETLTQSS